MRSAVLIAVMAGVTILLRALPFLIFRKQREYSLFCSIFSCFLCSKALGIIGIGITGIDLDDIVYQTHYHYPCYIDRLIGILFEKICHYRHMPRVFRIILIPAVT